MDSFLFVFESESTDKFGFKKGGQADRRGRGRRRGGAFGRRTQSTRIRWLLQDVGHKEYLIGVLRLIKGVKMNDNGPRD